MSANVAEFATPEQYKPTLAGLRYVVATSTHPAIRENAVEMAYLLGRLDCLNGVPDQSRDVK